MKCFGGRTPRLKSSANCVLLTTSNSPTATLSYWESIVYLWDIADHNVIFSMEISAKIFSAKIYAIDTYMNWHLGS
jgi:hypothetical protein